MLEPTTSQSFDFCKKITKKYATSFYVASRFLPKSKRDASYAIYAFSRFTDNLADEPMVDDLTKIKQNLDFLKKVCNLVFEGEDLNKIIKCLNFFSSKQEKEVAKQILPAFYSVSKSYNFEKKWFLDLIQGVETDLSKTRYQNFEELDYYCYQVAGTIGLIMSVVIGVKDKQALFYADKMGRALQLTNILRDVGEDLFKRDRVYLPLSIFHKYNVKIEDLRQRNLDQNFQNLISELISYNRQQYEQSWQGFNYLHPEGRFALKTACKIYAKILDRIEANHLDVLNQRAFTRKRDKLWSVMKLILKPTEAF